MGIPWGFDGEHGTDVRPPHVAATKAWAKNESQPGANDGTRVTAALVNRVVGNIRALADAAGSPLTESSDEDILHAVVALIGATAPAPHMHDTRYYQKAETDALLDVKVPISAIVDNLASTSALVPLSAAQGKVLKDLIDGLGDITPVADLAEAATLTGLDRGDLVHVGDNGAGKWARYQVTAVGDGTWAGCTKVLLWTQDQAPATHGHVAGDITDTTADGRAVVTAANFAAIRALLGTAAPCATRSVLKALDPAKFTAAQLLDGGRAGAFEWRTGDYSAQIAADTAEGIYIKADGVAASAGAWVRVYDGAVLPTWFGATPNAGSSQHTALQAWLDSGAEDLYLPQGIWRADSTVTCSHDVHLHGPGVLDFGAGSGQLLVTGAGLTALDPLSANVSRGGRALSWASSQGLAARDIVVLYNPTDYSWGSRRAYYRDGAAFRVHSISGNTANIYGQTVDPYLAANFDAYKMSTVRATIDIGGFVAAGSGSVPPLYLKWCADSRINKLSGHGGLYTICEIDQCFGVTVDLRAPINASPAAGDEYGVIVTNSTHVHFEGDASLATRHAIALGGRDTAGAIPCRYITVSDVTLCNGADGDDVGAADAHGNCDFVTYDNCTMLSGATVGGRNGTLRNCTIFGMDSAHGDCINSAEFVGSGTFTLENCTLISEGNGASVGYINIVPLGPSGAGSPAQTSMRGDLNVVIRNLTVRTPNAISTSRLVTLRPANADYKTNLTMDGVVWIAPAALAFVYAEDTTLSAMLSDGLSVDNVQGPSGTYLIYPTSDIAAVPTREMRQCGRASVTTTAASSIIASPVSYRYPYSRAPSGQCGISLTDGSASGQTAGQNAIPKLYAISNTQIRPAMLASANFTASVAVDLHWSAEVRGF